LERLFVAQPSGGFIQKEKFGLKGQGPCDLKPFLEAERKVPGRGPGIGFEPGPFHEISNFLKRFRMPARSYGFPKRRIDAMPESHKDIRLHIEIVEGPHNLEGPADPQVTDLVGLHAEDVFPLKQDFSCRGRVDPGDDIKKSGLACSIRPDNPEDFAGFSGEADPFQGMKPGKVLAK
jgi:hypothetical protein